MSWSTMSWEVNFFLPFSLKDSTPAFSSSKIHLKRSKFPPLFKCIKRAPFFVFQNWADGTALVQMIMVGAEKLHQHWLHHQSSPWIRVGKNNLSSPSNRVGKTTRAPSGPGLEKIPWASRVGKTLLSVGLNTVEKNLFSSPFDRVVKRPLRSTLGQSWKENLLCYASATKQNKSFNKYAKNPKLTKN